MVYGIPFYGWIIKAIVIFFISVPFWLFWTRLELGRLYFSFIPEVYISLPFWHVFGLIVIIDILKQLLIPTLFNIEQTVNNQKQ